MEPASHIVFVIPHKVHVLDISGPIHMFYEARGLGANLNMIFISPTQRKTHTSSAGLAFTNFSDFKTLSLTEKDIIFIPGVESGLYDDIAFKAQNRVFNRWLWQQHKKNVRIASICTGLFITAETGILNQKQCTTHWKYFDRFKSEFPEVILKEDRIFVEDENIFSSAGVSAGIDLALHLIESLFGPKIALDVARETVVFFRRNKNDSQLSHFLKYRNHLSEKIHLVQNYILENLSDTAMSNETIAGQFAMSSRNLSRKFKEVTGQSVGAYIKEARIEKTMLMLKNGDTLNTIANACGLKSETQLRRIIQSHFHQLPGDLRKKLS